jgi:hypothetical protein
MELLPSPSEVVADVIAGIMLLILAAIGRWIWGSNKKNPVMKLIWDIKFHLNLKARLAYGYIKKTFFLPVYIYQL